MQLGFKLSFAITSAFALIITLAACDMRHGSVSINDGATVKGNGVIKTEQRDVASFSHIHASGGFKIVWSKGKTALSVSGDENILPVIKTTVKDDRLTIESTSNYSPKEDIVITLSSGNLQGIQLNGGMSFSAKGIKAEQLKIEANGASKLTLDGTADTLTAQLNGASELEANELKTHTATVTIAGAGHGYANASKNLTASVEGVGMLKYSGNPASVTKSVAGVGSINAAD
jgi:hypothetical protein